MKPQLVVDARWNPLSHHAFPSSFPPSSSPPLVPSSPRLQRYRRLGQERLKTNQFSATDQFRPVGGGAIHGMRQVAALPGLFFIYELSPFMVQVTETGVPFTHFLTSVCAIVGGVFTIAGIVDSVLFHMPKAMGKAQ